MRFNVPINANNVVGRHKDPFIQSGFRFPTTKEVEEIVMSVAEDVFDQDNALVDRYFPQESTYASEIEMYLVRSQFGDSQGMTLVHQLGSNALPMDVRASKLDISKATWSPLHFKESKSWEEKEMLLLGRLTEEVQSSEIDGQVAEYIAWMLKRMKTRRDWMVWQVLTTGQIVIDDSDTYNPNALQYTVDFQFTDMELALTNGFEEKDGGTGESITDPIQYFQDLRKAATFLPEQKPVKIITNSQFVDVLADNTYIQYLVDYERGWTATDMRPPRAVYKTAALDVFRRYSEMEVEIYDGTYVDAAGAVQYWIPNGRMIVINQNDGPVGNFIYTGHIAGIGEDGAVQLGTGPYVHVDDRSRKDPPSYSIIGGFHGLPRVQGYNPKDFSMHRIKWLTYAAEGAVTTDYQTAFPAKAERRPLGDQDSPTGN